MGPRSATLAAWIAWIAIGGGNAVAIKVTNLELDPWWAATLRFVPAGLVFGALALLLRRTPASRSGTSGSATSRAAVRGAVIYGVLGFGLQYGLLYWGLQSMPAGTAQILIATVPIITLVLATAHGLERLRWQGLVGSVVALAGVATVFADQLSADIPPLALLAVLGCTICLAEAALVIKRTPGADPVVTNAIGMLVGGALLALLSVLSGERWIVPALPATWAATIFLVLGGSTAVFALYVFILGRWSASATSHGFLIVPLVTIVYGSVLLGEVVTPRFLLGGAILLVGVWIGVALRDWRLPPGPTD